MVRLALLAALAAALAATAARAAGPPPLIAFTAARVAGAYTVYTVRPDGTGRRSLGVAYKYAEGVLPAWARDGSRVAFSGAGVAVVPATGGARRDLGDGFDDNIGEGP